MDDIFHWIIMNINRTKTWMEEERVKDYTFQQSDCNLLLNHNVFFPWLHQKQIYEKYIHTH
jgi:hypothetical protein